MNCINRPELVREHNLTILRDALFHARRATRQQLSEATGISTVTLGTLLPRLIGRGEAYEAETEPSGGGRPVHVYCYNEAYRHGAVLMVRQESHGFSLWSGIINLYGELVHEERQPADRWEYRETLAFMRSLLERKQGVGVIAVGLPGVGFHEYFHSRQEGRILSLEALEQAGREAGIPVVLENDINLAALGFTAREEPKSREAMAYFYLMKHCYAGSAVCIGGALHHGMGRFAGELPSCVYGVDWKKSGTEGPEAARDNLLKVLLPCLCVLAPSRVVIASDYIGRECLPLVRESILSRLGPHCCPELVLTPDFARDYASGLIRAALERLNLPALPAPNINH